MFGRLALAGGVGVVVLVGMAVHYTDRAFNYVEVQGRVDAVKSTCKLERTSFYGVGRRREWTRDMPCDIARMLRAEDPEMKGMHLKRTSDVTLRYTSPADGQVHSGKLHLTVTDDRQPEPKAGGVLNVMANKSRPDKIQKL